MYAYVFERKKYPFEDVRRERAYGNKLFCRSYARLRAQTRDGTTSVTVAFSCFFNRFSTWFFCALAISHVVRKNNTLEDGI